MTSYGHLLVDVAIFHTGDTQPVVIGCVDEGHHGEVVVTCPGDLRADACRQVARAGDLRCGCRTLRRRGGWSELTSTDRCTRQKGRDGRTQGCTAMARGSQLQVGTRPDWQLAVDHDALAW